MEKSYNKVEVMREQQIDERHNDNEAQERYLIDMLDWNCDHWFAEKFAPKITHEFKLFWVKIMPLQEAMTSIFGQTALCHGQLGKLEGFMQKRNCDL